VDIQNTGCPSTWSPFMESLRIPSELYQVQLVGSSHNSNPHGSRRRPIRRDPNHTKKFQKRKTCCSFTFFNNIMSLYICTNFLILFIMFSSKQGAKAYPRSVKRKAELVFFFCWAEDLIYIYLIVIFRDGVLASWQAIEGREHRSV